MKNQDFLSLFLIIIMALLIGNISGGCSKQEKPGPLCGAWKMVSANYSGPNFNTICSEDRICYKVISMDHFALVEMFRSNPDSMLFTAVGEYSLTDSTYTEKYEATNVPYQSGNEITFLYKIQNDHWIISKETEDLNLHEVWERIK